jgi:putative intracellular protease/amidase
VKNFRVRLAASLATLALALLASRASGVFPTSGIDAPVASDAPAPAPAPAKKWVCTPCHDDHDKVEFDKPGSCPVCGMPLIEKSEAAKAEKQMLAAMKKTRKRAEILVFAGVEIIDFGAPYEILGQAGLEVATVAEKPDAIATAMGLKITPDYTLEKAPLADVIVVPGGGVLDTQQSPAVQKWLRERAEKAQVVLSVCNGAFILAKSGLLDGKSATTFAPLIEGLRAAAPKTNVVNDKRWVDNGKIVTSAGLSSGIDGALHVVEKLYGRGEAQRVAVGLEYHWDPEGRWVRAQLADRVLADFYRTVNGWDADVVAYEGTTDAWENRWRVRTSDSPAAVLDSIGKALNVPAKDGKFTLKDDKGGRWSGVATATAAPDAPGALLVTLRIERAQA